MTDRFDNFVNKNLAKKYGWKHNGSRSNQITEVILTMKKGVPKWEVLKNGKNEIWNFDTIDNDVYIGNHVFPYDEMMDDNHLFKEVHCDMDKSRGQDGTHKLRVNRTIIKPTE